MTASLSGLHRERTRGDCTSAHISVSQAFHTLLQTLPRNARTLHAPMAKTSCSSSSASPACDERLRFDACESADDDARDLRNMEVVMGNR